VNIVLFIVWINIEGLLPFKCTFVEIWKKFFY